MADTKEKIALLPTLSDDELNKTINDIAQEIVGGYELNADDLKHFSVLTPDQLRGALGGIEVVARNHLVNALKKLTEQNKTAEQTQPSSLTPKAKAEAAIDQLKRVKELNAQFKDTDLQTLLTQINEGYDSLSNTKKKEFERQLAQINQNLGRDNKPQEGEHPKKEALQEAITNLNVNILANDFVDAVNTVRPEDNKLSYGNREEAIELQQIANEFGQRLVAVSAALEEEENTNQEQTLEDEAESIFATLEEEENTNQEQTLEDEAESEDKPTNEEDDEDESEDEDEDEDEKETSQTEVSTELPKTEQVSLEVQQEDINKDLDANDLEVSEEEISANIEQLEDAYYSNKYIADINPKISQENIDTILGLEKAEDRAIALSNPDDMLVALENATNNMKQEERNQIKDIIEANLNDIDANQITPDNAYSYYLLAENFKDNEELQKKVYKNITQGLKKYDQTLFNAPDKVEDIEFATPAKSDEEMAENYEKVNHYLEEAGANLGREFLSENFLLTDENGKELRDKDRSWLNPKRLLFDEGKGNDLTDCQNSIIELARELVAQELATAGTRKKNEDGTEVDLTETDYEKLMQDKINMILATNKKDDNSKSVLTKDEIIGRMAGHMVRAEQFKERAKQKGYNQLYQSTTTWLQRLDKRFTDRFGSKYTKAKKVIKTVGKVAGKSVTGAVKFAAISAVAGPVGVAGYLGYGVYKQWKETAKSFKDKNLSGTEKAAKVFGAVVSTALTGAMALGGLDASGTGLQQALGDGAAHFVTSVASMGVWSRTGITTVVNAIPDTLKRISLNRQNKKIKKALKEEKDPNKIKELMTKQTSIQKALKDNKEKLIVSVIAAGVGTFVGTQASAAIHGGVNLDRAEVKEQIDTLLNNHGTRADSLLQAATQHADTLVNGSADPKTVLENLNDTTILNPVIENEATAIEANQQATLQEKANVENKNPTAEEIAQEKANVENKNPTAEEIAQAKANNLQTAEARTVHPSGVNAHQMAENDLAREASNLGGMADAEQTALAKTMSEGYGQDSYRAIHSALAEPTHVTTALRATMPEAEFKALGLDNSPTSAELLEVLAKHPELAQNEGLQGYMDSHFNAKDQFTPTEGVHQRVVDTSNTNTNTNQNHNTNLVSKDESTLNVKVEIVTQEVGGKTIPTTNMPTNNPYASNRYVSMPDLAMEVDVLGKVNGSQNGTSVYGYRDVVLDTITGQVICVPNNPTADKPVVFSSTREAYYNAENDSNAFCGGIKGFQPSIHGTMYAGYPAGHPASVAVLSGSGQIGGAEFSSQGLIASTQHQGSAVVLDGGQLVIQPGPETTIYKDTDGTRYIIDQNGNRYEPTDRELAAISKANTAFDKASAQNIRNQGDAALADAKIERNNIDIAENLSKADKINSQAEVDAARQHRSEHIRNTTINVEQTVASAGRTVENTTRAVENTARTIERIGRIFGGRG